MHYGAWPPKRIDHINGEKSDNRIVNLRLAEAVENMANRGPLRSNALGVKGVCVLKKNGKYHAQIRVGGRKHHLGFFSDLDSAAQAYAHAEREVYGEFAFNARRV